MICKLAVRVFSAFAALLLSSATLCVTAFAEPTTDNVTVNLSRAGVGNSLTVILPQPQNKKLVDAVCEQLTDEEKSAVDGGAALTINLGAELMPNADFDGESSAGKLLVGTKQHFMVQLSLTWQVSGGEALELNDLGSEINVTLEIPKKQQAADGLYQLVMSSKGEAIVRKDLDSVPNTVTFATGSMGVFAVVNGELATLEVQPEPELQPEPKPEVQVESGGIPAEYMPGAVLAQPVVVIPVSTTPPDGVVHNGMAATSMMMTVALVSGSIDEENSYRDEVNESNEDLSE